MTGIALAAGNDGTRVTWMPVPQIATGISATARDLIWNSFFVEAGRGTTFERHLPWHADPAIRSIVIADDISAGATAIIRPAPQAGVAMIGYVCVASSLRGKGYGRSLMAALNDVLDDLGYRAALLWTGKPEVYVGQGYEIIGRDRFITIGQREGTAAGRTAISTEVWPQAGEPDGLPAFATHGFRHRSDRATAIVACGPRGTTMLDWQGDPADVAILLDTAGYSTWSVNLAAHDPFAERLPVERFALSHDDGAFAMVRRTDPAFVPAHVPQSNRI